MIVIYHERDFDGFCSGAICKKKYPDAKLIGYDYGQPIPYDQMEAGQPIIMVDCSLPVADMVTLGMYSRQQFTWIDHHASAISDYEVLASKNPIQANYINPVLKQGIAACEITWQHLFPDEEMPIPVLLLGQFDTWRNSNKLYWERTVLPFQYGMKLPGIQTADDFPQALFNPYDKDVAKVVDNIINNGLIALQYQQSVDKTNMQNAFELEFEGLKVIACNGAGFGSMAFDSIPDLESYDIMMPFKYDGEKWVFSLYTAKASIDCSVIAKKYGGGGHVSAAGFSSKELPEFIKAKTQAL